ncbi:hypothetical protein Tco_1479949, partial [Tanacetum coccineum]
SESRLRPYHFSYPERSLTMEEILNKFIDEGKREHEGVTTRGVKTTTQDVHNNDTNVPPKEPVVAEPEKPVRSSKVLTNDRP